MTVKLTFGENVPSWTKLGTAEFFRLLNAPKEKESEIKEKALDVGIRWNLEPFWIEGNNDKEINNFLTFCAQWYTENRLILNSNFDLLLETDSEGNQKK